MNIETKNGGKKARKISYQKHTYIASKKDGKKSSGKSGKTRFFLKKHEYRDQKMGGKKREKIFFPETHVYRELKTMKQNRLEKLRKHVFYKHTNIVIKNGGKKQEEKIFKNTRIG